MPVWHIRILRRRREERRLLLAIAREAHWMARGRAISRQAAYNCIPDLLKAEAAYQEWRRGR